MENQFDLVVIGAGPGGYVGAIRAAQLGMRTAVIEELEAGGTCLNRGCIPTKTLLHTAQLLHTLKDAEALGITVEGLGCNMPALLARKREVVSQLRGGIEKLLAANRVERIAGHGTILAPHLVQAGERQVSAKYILVATGSRPQCPPIPGIGMSGVITSDELLESDRVHPRLCIIGGGVIGVEFATVYSALGSQVTILEGLERILPSMDREISQNLSMLLRRRGVALHTGSMVREITQHDGALCVHFEEKGKPGTAEADAVLVATGRRPNTEGLLGPGVQLQLDRGGIVVDERFASSLEDVYAVGDVTAGSIQLAHAASAQAIAAVEGLCGRDVSAALGVIPACVYTEPEIAAVGLTADGAKEAGTPVKTGKALMGANGKTVIERGERGFVKLVFHAQTEVLLGAQLMCSRATDLIAELADAVANGLTLTQLARVVRPHPTFCEAVTEACEAALGHAIHSMPGR